MVLVNGSVGRLQSSVGLVAEFCWQVAGLLLGRLQVSVGQVAGRLYVSARQVSCWLQVSVSILLLNIIMFSRHFSDDNIYSCLLRRY